VEELQVNEEPELEKKLGDVIDDAIKAHVTKAMRIHDGNKARAAKWLGIDRRSLYRYLDRWGRDFWRLPT
jgi:transcriptional regulator with PAS, ATPase and Fis domain